MEYGAYGKGSRGKDCFGLLPTKRVPGWGCQVNSRLHPTLDASWHQASQLRLAEYGARRRSFVFLFLVLTLREQWLNLANTAVQVRGSQQTGLSKTNSSRFGSVLSFLLTTFFLNLLPQME